ncbi:alanine racemase [Parasutterella secunda]|uniref:Alanine racemase n=1 Tax=Parasutterella secunda TaxID=626947 RepID=A0ABS2GR98_9BURK|nr:alanine racemase [Parasutterella secunda]MBM6928335.1 alanine racemase [Parasutterella secunda]
MPRPIAATIHMGALRHNLQRMREAAKGRTLWAVVKANAYGHGLLRAARAFEEADGLALIDLCDAQKVREQGWTKRILLLEGFFDESDLPLLEKFDIETIVHNRHMIEILKAHAPFKSLKVHIKINSGMNRLGFLATEEEGVRAELEAIEGVRVMGVVTHFANAEPTYEADKPATVSLQLSRMRQIEPRPEHLCMANSAATLWQDDVKGDAVRAGVALYGASPDSHYTSEDLDIRPAMTLSAKILAIQNVPAGEAIGYGSRFVTHRDSRIAVVACGYADGYPRSTPDGTPTYVEGKIAPIAGAISMDMLTIDVTDVPEARLGSEVELWGSHIPVNEVAKRCGTIGYELLCAIALRVPIVEDEQ